MVCEGDAAIDTKPQYLQSVSTLVGIQPEQRSAESLSAAILRLRNSLGQEPDSANPLGWAAAQHRLGNSLIELARLKDASEKAGIEANKAGMVVTFRPPVEHPVRESSKSLLNQAVVAFQDALMVLDRDLVPLDWASTQHQLGIAYAELAKEDQFHFSGLHGKVEFEAAIECFHRALSERTRERAPLEWATTTYWLGKTLAQLAEKEVSAEYPLRAKEHFKSSVMAFREALKEIKAEGSPSDWRILQQDLAQTLDRWGNALGSVRLLSLATKEYRRLLHEISAGRFGENPSYEKGPHSYDETLDNADVQAIIAPDLTTGTATLQDRSIITRAGIRYLPLQLASHLAQASESAIRKWISNNVKFENKKIQSHSSLTTDIYIAEESVSRMAKRFVKWPSNEPAGSVTLGETDDQSGYLGLTDAARVLHVSHHTIWLWVTQGKAPTAHPLNVIRCAVSDHLYIGEKDISELQELVPRSGLRRGRRRLHTAEK